MRNYSKCPPFRKREREERKQTPGHSARAEIAERTRSHPKELLRWKWNLLFSWAGVSLVFGSREDFFLFNEFLLIYELVFFFFSKVVRLIIFFERKKKNLKIRFWENSSGEFIFWLLIKWRRKIWLIRVWIIINIPCKWSECLFIFCTKVQFFFFLAFPRLSHQIWIYLVREYAKYPCHNGCSHVFKRNLRSRRFVN